MIYRLLAAIILPLVHLKIRRVEGKDLVPGGGVIVVANHASWLDPVYLLAALRGSTQRKLVFLASTKKFAWTGALLPIDWKHRATVLERAKDRLTKGESIALFPMGSVRNGEGDRPRTGAARLARWTGAPVVPAALLETPAGHTMPSLFRFFFSRNRATIRFGKPLTFAAQPVTHDSLHDDMRRIMNAITSLQWPTR